MKKFLYLIILIFCGVSASSQVNMSEKVNEIKLSDEYLWGQFSWWTQDSAYICAQDRLMEMINCNRPQEKKLLFDNVKDKVGRINRERINSHNQQVFMVFLYVKASDIEDIDNAGEDMSVNQVKTSDNQPNISKTYYADVLVKEIMGQTGMSQIINLLKESVAEGEVSAFGPIAQAENVDKLMLIICDRETLAPKAVLSEIDSTGKRINLVDGTASEMSEYRGCVGIWIKK